MLDKSFLYPPPALDVEMKVECGWLDMVMPNMNGIETLKRMRQIDSNLQIIVLTGHAKLEQGVEAMKLGAFDFLEKPVDINTLIKKITEAWEKKQDLDEKKVDSKLSEIVKKKGW